MNACNCDSKKVGTLCKTHIKTECNDMQIFFNLHSTEYRTKTKYLMFKLINLMLFCKYTFMVNLMPAMPALWDNKHQQNDRFQLTVPK